MDILLKLGLDYSVFVSTFHATKLTAQSRKMPKLVEFMESLTQEQDKLVMVGTIKPSRVDSKCKKKAKIEILLREKCIYRFTMATKADPNAAAEKIK